MNVVDGDPTLVEAEDKDPPLPDRLQTVADMFQLLVNRNFPRKSIIATSLRVIRGNVPRIRKPNKDEDSIHPIVVAVSLNMQDVFDLRDALKDTTNHVTNDVRNILDILFAQRDKLGI